MLSFPAPSFARFSIEAWDKELVWSLSAFLSVTTSRFILFQRNWHFPFHLATLQLTILLFWLPIQSRLGQDALPQPFTGGRRVTTQRNWLMLCIDGLGSALSFVLFSQATLHFANTPVLFMLGIFAFYPVEIVNTILALSGNRRRRNATLLLGISSLSLILALEYRLTVNGLVFGVLGVGAIGVVLASRALLDTNHHIGVVGPDGLLVTIVSLIISAYCTLRYEDTHSAISWFQQASESVIGIFLVNIISTTTAIMIGSDVFVFIPQKQRDRHSLQLPSLWPLLCTSLGLVSYNSISELSITHPIQVLLYSASLLAITDVNYRSILDAVKASGRNPRQTLSVLMQFNPISNNAATANSSQAVIVADEEESTSPNGQFIFIQQPESECSDHSFGKALKICTIAGLVIVCFWTWLSSGDTTRDFVPHLDLSYQPDAPFDVVISMYDEPLNQLAATLSLLLSIPAISSRTPRVFIYTKDASANLQGIASAVGPLFGKPSVTLLDNVGREGETYLHHILSHWDTLGNHTIFLQAQTHNPRELGPRIRNFFDADTGMLPLGFSGYSCPCDGPVCADRFWTDDSGIVRETYLRAAGLEVCPPPPGGGRRRRRRWGWVGKQQQRRLLPLSYKGQFVASAARIRGTDRAVYEDLHRALRQADGWAHREGYLKGRPDLMSAPVFGFTMERMWAVLLQCAEERIVSRCPSLLSRWRLGGDRSDCQCFDHA